MAESQVTIELNPREKRLYDRLRTQVIERRPGESAGVRDLLLLLPDLTVCTLRLLRDERVPLASKALAVLGAAYVLSPIDLIPGLIFGPIGLVDDLVIVAATLSKILNDVHPDVVRSHWSGPGDVLDAVQRVTHWTETLFTVRLRGLVRSVLGSR
jgi:uncharacterized membrane protein YkvA (DUF1232 family)